MAAVVEMGEVDDMHSKEEGSIITNGDLSNDIDMENQESQDSIKQSSLPESMEVDEIESNEAKERHDQISTTEDSTEDNENTAEEHEEKENNVDKNEINNEEKENNVNENEVGVEENAEDNENTAEETTGEENDTTTAEDSSAETDNRSELNEDESSQETKESDGQGREQGNSEQGDTVDGSDDEKSKLVENDSDSRNKDSVDNDSQDSPNDNFSGLVIEKVHTVEEDEIHEIVSDDDEPVITSKPNETIEVHDSGGEDDGDVMFIETPKENGTDIIDLQETPEKKPPPKPAEIVTPRRSTRNLHKNKSYVEEEKEASPSPQPSEESDIEEVLPQDPLACSDSITVERLPPEKPKPMNKAATIVVKDTKRLVEIASKSNSTTTSGKKEPTLVIIDTNSILSGRGPVPVINKPTSAPQQPQPPAQSPTITNPSYPSMLPMALPAQGMYPPNMRATITPIPMNASIANTPPPKTSPATITPTLTTPLLPTLTDDMFVVEAPSFIVPYVYEKPPVKDFKSFVKELQEAEKKQEQDDKEKSESESKEKSESESKDKNDTEKSTDKEDTKVDSDNNEQKSEKVPTDEPKKEVDDPKKPYSYFQSPLGKFFINIGFNLVQEYVQTDLLKQQKRKASREGGSNPETEKTIKSLVKNLEFSKENNEPFKAPIKKCEFCNFKTESAHVMAYHLETPHMKNFVYKCNFCPYEVRSPHDILYHMEAEHAIRGHLERAPAFHQCPSCPFEDNQKGKMSRHLVACMKKFKPERNLEPPVDWEPPAKIPRVPKMRQQGLNATAAAYQALSKNTQYQFLSKMQLQNAQQVMQRGRGRPQLGAPTKNQTVLRPAGMVYKQQTMTGGSVLVPTNYQLSGNQVFQVVGGQDLSGRLGNPGHMFLPGVPSASSTMAAQNATPPKKPTQQPSISITPLPRAATTTPAKPGDTTSKNSFVICEICDGYIKDLEQLRNHMQWIHKIKIHPKMIYNRPPLNCQKCQFRFFTDQGLERHLLGSHGLVTSSMQDAANKSKDSGRCPVCGRVYQWKLLNHVARDHNMTLKPAHLSYKCTVCTATFGMYKQFENHVYSAHSVVAKRVMDKKGNTASPSVSNKSTDQLKPLKINDEITIIPQPTKSSNGSTKDSSSSGTSTPKNSTPSTSKNPDTAAPSNTRAERLARRNAYEDA